MPRSDEAEAFYVAVYLACQEIPEGKVTSYGHIAKLIGRPDCPRQVGICLKHLPSVSIDPDAEFHSESVPWQRVINSKGVISQRGLPSGAADQAEALRREGVVVGRGTLGEFTVNFDEYGWFVRRLPSRADEPDSSDEEEQAEG